MDDLPDCCCVCTEPTEVWAVQPCGHDVMCIMCAFRMRELSRDKRCVFCKATAETIVASKLR